MKTVLARCAFLAGSLVLLAGNPAGAISINDAVGQSVYDVHDMKVGVIRGITNETGQRSAIVTVVKAGMGNQNVLIITRELQPRSGGGWLSVLPAGSILDMPPYIPGHMLPL